MRRHAQGTDWANSSPRPEVHNLSFEERLGLLVNREITERHS